VATVRRRILSDGRELHVREDGSTYIYDPQSGTKTPQSGPDPDIAGAFYDPSALDAQIQAITDWQQSPAGQRAERLRAEAYDEDVRRFDLGYDLQRDQFGLQRENQRAQLGLSRDRLDLERELGRGNLDVSRQNADTSRYSAETGRMDTEARIAELERRFGLDLAKFGTSYVTQAIEYAKTPRKWVDSLLWERGATPIYQSIAAGANAPAFGAKGTAGSAPGMNNITDTMSSLGYMAPNGPGAAMDPTKALQQILKAVPPGQSPSGKMSPTEIAAINLATELYRGGGTNAPEGYWEGLDKDEQDSLLGVMDYLGPGASGRFLRDYSRTRIPTRFNPNSA
jgi:hypothetical protein